ncbi:hypothetical protein CMO88_01150 [Candidatus Woesearchaeota archaeon]|nr:hypothetical protein [Candidatus Woesearchaeota archaeon]|tara:strand:- start:2078 stop:5494 length:3417 start_codon:yes stop_codon:yes gene_type:complete
MAESQDKKDYGDNIKVVEDKKDEDVEIDFGKITGLFKRKKSSEGKEPISATTVDSKNETKSEHKAEDVKENDKKIEHETSKSDDSKDEIDVGKAIAGIKGIFKGAKSGAKESKGDEDFDISSVMNFLKKYHMTLFLILGIVVSVGIGFNLRMQSGELGFTDNWARNSIDQTINNDIASFVSQTYPNLPDSNRQQLAAEELNKAKRAGTYTFKTSQFAGQTINLQQQIEIASQQFKTFYQDETGKNYMPDIDPYYWWRYSRNIVEKGHVGDEIRDGMQWDNHQFAPVGRMIAPKDTFYPQSIVLFYNVAKIFKPGLELQRALMFYPVFISALSTLIVFLLTRRIAGNVAAFFAATMVGVHAALINRTQFGHGDSDAIVIFFAVLVLWLFIEAVSAKRIMLKIVFAALSGIATTLYSLTWGGWWWIFDFILASAAATFGLFVLYQAFTGKGTVIKNGLNSLKNSVSRKIITITATYFAVTGITMTITSGLSTFLLTPVASIGFRTLKTPVVGSAAPNVLRTVAELNEGTAQQAINQIGSSLFYIAVFGIILIIARAAFEAYKKERDNEKIVRDLFYAVVLTIWFIATLYAVTKGIRFVLLLVPAFSIAFGIVFGLITGYVGAWTSKQFKFNKLIVMTIVFAMLFMMFPGPTFNSDVVNAARNVVNNDVPLINDAWFNSLNSIKENSKEDAIITSWWDFGHHFKSLADRAVTFDGTTQAFPQAHWVGRFFSTSDEREAIGILRMLNCGAHFGTHELEKKSGKDNVYAVKLTKKIIMLDRDGAKQVLLEEELSEQEANEILELTHCNPPESFVIASEDMIGKSGVWGHFGAWDYTKADIWKAVGGKPREEAVQYMKETHEMSEEEANSIYEQMQGISNDGAADAWIGPWNGFSGGVHGCSIVDELIKCGDGLIVDPADYNAWYPTPQGNQHPISISYPTAEGEVIKKTFDNNTVPQNLGILLIPSGGNYNRIVGSPELVDGMFAKMFYMQGHSLKYFKLLTRQQSFTGTNIWVWQVDWEGKQQNIMNELKPVEEKTEVSLGDEVMVNYIGYLEDGTVFDSSINDFRGKGVTKETGIDEYPHDSMAFTTGLNSVIPGFEKGILGTKLNEEKIITVEPEQGYTDPSHVFFNTTLYFKVKIAEIK